MEQSDICPDCKGTGKNRDGSGNCPFCTGSGLAAPVERTWLIQRLNAPRERIKDPKGIQKLGRNPFAFGGGLARGGMAEEPYETMEDIFSFDYMGAAEFEWGALPKALKVIAAAFNQDLGCTGEIKIRDTIVYYICPLPYKGYVLGILPMLAAGKVHTKEWTGFEDAVKGRKSDEELANRRERISKFNPDPIRWLGWLELDNGFMFFVDKVMFEKTAVLFRAKRYG